MLLLCQVLRDLLFDSAVDVLVQHAGDQGLIGQPFFHGFLLEVNQVSLSHPDVDTLVLTQGCPCGFLHVQLQADPA